MGNGLQDRYVKLKMSLKATWNGMRDKAGIHFWTSACPTLLEFPKSKYLTLC